MTSFHSLLENTELSNDKQNGVLKVKQSFIDKYSSEKRTEELRQSLMRLRTPTWNIINEKDGNTGFISTFRFVNGKITHKGILYNRSEFTLFIHRNKLFKIEVRLEK